MPQVTPTSLALPGMPTPSATINPKASPKPTPTPPPNARKGIEGVWEVQIQKGSQTTYTHFKLLHQQGGTLSGVYLDTNGKKYPLAGSLDGQAIRLIVSMPNGTTTLLEGRLDGTTDMVGMMTTTKGETAFTAAYRPKEKWIDNISPSPGGIGTGTGGYTPPKH
jgi:hypothetical protein